MNFSGSSDVMDSNSSAGMEATNKQRLLSHTVDAISILLSHSEIFIAARMQRQRPKQVIEGTQKEKKCSVGNK